MHAVERDLSKAGSRARRLALFAVSVFAAIAGASITHAQLLAPSASSAHNPDAVLTPGWATPDEQQAVLAEALKNQQIVVVIRTADSYATKSKRETVHTWAQMPALNPCAKLRLSTRTSTDLVYKTLKAQLDRRTSTPDLWLATADLKLLAYVPCPKASEKPFEVVQPALAQAAALASFQTHAQRQLAHADKMVASGHLGPAWKAVLGVARQDAQWQQTLRPGDQTKDGAAADDAVLLTESSDGEDSNPSFYEDPGPGFFYDGLFHERLTEYTRLADQRVADAASLLAEGNTAEARKRLAPLLVQPMQIPATQTARQLIAEAKAIDREKDRQRLLPEDHPNATPGR